MVHLVKRFVGSLLARPVSVQDRNWVMGYLSEPEGDIWLQMGVADQNHSLGVAQAVASQINHGGETNGVPASQMIAAALLHDSGKTVSDLATMTRVFATLVWAVTSDAKAVEWAGNPTGWKKRLGQYRLHPQIGAARLETVGSRPFVVDWVRDHHQPQSQWSTPPQAGQLLRRCDDD